MSVTMEKEGKGPEAFSPFHLLDYGHNTESDVLDGAESNRMLGKPTAGAVWNVASPMILLAMTR